MDIISPLDRRSFLKKSGMAIAGLGVSSNSDAGGGREGSRSSAAVRTNPAVDSRVDYVVVGGGVAGVCSAITAARAGLKVVLIQDRPVPGGNASSEVRLWVLGATCHMSNNNRWAREGGVHEELMVENMYRNREGNPLFFDALLTEKLWAEPNITLLLNTAVYGVEMAADGRIGKVRAFCSQNQTQYAVSAPLFCDASGDGIVGFLAGAAFRMGAESGDEFGEKFIMPDDYGKLLGHSMYFYSKDTGRPVKYVAPAFALKDIPGKIPGFKNIHRDSSGCRLWWLEWGDDLDRVFDSEKIKEELWRVVYGVWDYIKNSGTFKDVDNLTLEWVSTVPGKRESRRFEGDYILRQQDVIDRNRFDDAVAYGGWAIDLHPAAGVYSHYPGCTQYHSKGVYGIPYRCIYSRNIANLFMGGRLVSVSHVAFGSTRVISTGTLCAQAAALAAVLCRKYDISPRDVYEKGHVAELQRMLVHSGQYIPGVRVTFPGDRAGEAKITASGTLSLSALPGNGEWRTLDRDTAMLLPFPEGRTPRFTFNVKAGQPTVLKVAFHVSRKADHFTPDERLSVKEYALEAGTAVIDVDFSLKRKERGYGFIIFQKNEQVSVEQSDLRVTGILSLFYRGSQLLNEKFGVEEVPFYTPGRRPGGKNLALKIKPALEVFGVEQLTEAVFRPSAAAPNAWVAPPEQDTARLKCEWKQPVTVRTVILWFDTDFDHPMESCLMGHPEDVMPFCVQQYKIMDGRGEVIYETQDNHSSRNEIRLETPVQTSALTVQLHRANGNVPVSLFGIQVFG